MQTQASRHQRLVEGVEGAVVLSDGLDRTQPLDVDDLGATQEKADPLLQPLCLLLQATIAGQPFKQLANREAREALQIVKGDIRVTCGGGGGNRGSTGGFQPLYFCPLMMNIHCSQHDMS